MRKLISSLVLLISLNLTRAQSVGIGTSTPAASAALDITSSSKGFLPPRLSQTQRLSINNPAEGLLVYDTTSQRFFQFQDGVWRFIINSDYWVSSTTRNFVFNSGDSIGLGTFTPQQRLDVLGDIEATNINADHNITAAGNASAPTIQSLTDMSAGGSAIVAGNIQSNQQLIIDKASATLQFKNSGVNKTFMQLSGDDLRLGTNSGNSTGSLVIRTNGDDALKVDTNSRLYLAKGFFETFDYGSLIIGNKLILPFNSANALPVLYGRIFSDGFAASMWPQSGTSQRISTGIYEIDTHLSNASANGVITTTLTGTTAPRICVGRYVGSGKYRVEIFSSAGTHVNSDFYFMINDPML